ncbi:MAG: metallophosphoesterase [Planctomycetes bacterium]|nr:metallophosphoesterase [Planctomycetota bacterium]
MSGTPRPPLSRRQLLKGSLALAACAGRLRPDWAWAEDSRTRPAPAGEPEITRWALLSDTHVAADPQDHYHAFYPYRNLQEVIAQIACDPPDGLVITGDLARLKGKREDYQNFRTLLTPIDRRPIYLGLGNHDDRDGFFRVFPDRCEHPGIVKNKHITLAQAGPVRMIVLDTLLKVNGLLGRLGDSQRTWLETVLQSCDDRPTILFLHHAPHMNLLDRRRLFEIIKPQGKIKAVVSGHSHRYEYSEVAGIHLISLPSTGYTIWSDAPVGWVDAKLTARGGEFTLHAFEGDCTLDGHTHTLRWRA